jgi:hypothetical protein
VFKPRWRPLDSCPPAGRDSPRDLPQRDAAPQTSGALESRPFCLGLPTYAMTACMRGRLRGPEGRKGRRSYNGAARPPVSRVARRPSFVAGPRLVTRARHLGVRRRLALRLVADVRTPAGRDGLAALGGKLGVLRAGAEPLLQSVDDARDAASIRPDRPLNVTANAGSFGADDASGRFAARRHAQRRGGDTGDGGLPDG